MFCFVIIETDFKCDVKMKDLFVYTELQYKKAFQ